MQKGNLITLVWILCALVLSSQDFEPKIPLKPSPEYFTEIIGTPKLQFKSLYKTISPYQADMRFEPFLQHPASINASEEMDELASVKSAKDYLKHPPYSRERNSSYAESPSGGAEILIGYSFYGDIDAACPNDNTIAISKAGRIISMMNEYVGIYTTQGNKLNNYSLSDFFNGLLPNSLCDPKVLYDPVADRFFMYIQECNDDPQYIAFGFSQSNNPNGFWNIYLFNSDALGDGSWTDYPKVAINDSEIFISVNLFGRGSGGSYKQSVVYQLDKAKGYAGDNLPYKIWTGFQSGTILPIRSGANGLYGPGIYAVQGRAGGADYFYLYDITGSLYDPNARLISMKIPTDPYEPSGNAYQLGTTVRLDIGDCRFQDGYYQSGLIHFVFSADDQGYSGIRYHRLDPVKMDGNNYKLVSSSDLRDYCYPSIEPFSSGTNKSSVVHFTSSGENHYPDIRAKHYYDDFDSDPSIRVKVGPGPHTKCYSSSRNSARWGDYTGSARHYGKTNPTIWIAGSVGNNTSGSWWTYIAELYSSPTATEQEKLEKAATIFPNPADQRVSIELPVNNQTPVFFELHDDQGILISSMYQGILFPGDNKFSFNTSTLQNGIYYLTLKSINKQKYYVHKIVIQH